MTITYREDDPISARWTGKGGRLSNYEGDLNQYNHETRIATLETNYSATVSIDTFLQPNASTFQVRLTDGSIKGPFDLPLAKWNPVDWALSTPYLENDIFNAPDGGTYLVIYPHTSSATSFDPNANDGAGHDYYFPVIPPRGNVLPAGGASGMMLRKSTDVDYEVSWAYPLPTGGTARKYLIKQSSATQDADWDTPTASDIAFSPSTGSTLTSTNVADAIEEAASSGGGGGSALADLSDVQFATGEPQLGGLLYFNGTKWIPLDGADTGGVLWFDGTDWRTTAEPSAANYVVKWNGSQWVSAPQRDTTVTALGTSGAVDLDPSLGDVFSITPSGDTTINCTSTSPGAKITVIVTTSGTTSHTITFGTNFRSQGTLATGIVSGKQFTVSFVGDGGASGLVETCRTAAM